MMKYANRKRKIRGINTFTANILSAFKKNPYRLLNHKQISSQLGIKDKASKDLIIKILKDLSENKEIEELRPGKYKLNIENIQRFAIKSSYITGKVDMKRTGKAYIIPDDDGEDIYIAPNNTFHAFHDDYVKVLLFPQRKAKKLEGQIIEILSRAKEKYVGTIKISKYFAFVIADSSKMSADIFIPLEEINGAKNGEKVIVKITEWPDQSKNPFGKVISVLGKPGEHEVEMNSILAEYDFPLSFSKKIENDAAKMNRQFLKDEIKIRKDFRNITTFTIDPKHAKDFDDALSIKILKNGNFEIGIHIADVSYYVKSNTLIDKEALNRATSVYLVDRVIPMLPEILSNDICSLQPKKDKFCFSVVFELDENAKILNYWFGKTIINSDHRFNYDEVQEIIDTKKGEFVKEILILNDLAKKLRQQRYKNGAIDFRSSDIRFNLDERGKPLNIYIKEQKDSNRLIEDFMLLANRTVAEFIGKKNDNKNPKTFVYRIHDEPNPEKLNTFLQFINKLGYQMKINSRNHLAKSFNSLFTAVKGKGEENMIETIAIRTMAKAEYSTKNIGHYGLAFSHYSHFTSPIRRYPDLLTHRLLERYLHKKPSVDQKEFEQMCQHCSEMERKAEAAERESIKYKQTEFMLDKIGQQFPGIISGVSKWGLYVEIEKTKCEGMVRLKDLHDDFYYLDEDNYQVIGQRYGTQYKLGDNVQVFVKRIDLSKKQMDFELVN